ncbi:hypothetical protein NDU88_004216, partial [Pleurodeles waltl]
RIMTTLLKGIDKVCIFQDDVLIHACDRCEHDVILKQVLSKFDGAGVVLEREKFQFLQTSVEYLGHVITAEGVYPRPGLADAICRDTCTSGQSWGQIIFGTLRVLF